MALVIGGKRVVVPGGRPPAEPLTPTERLLVEGIVKVSKEFFDAINVSVIETAIESLDVDSFERLLNQVLNFDDVRIILDSALRDVVLSESLSQLKSLIVGQPRFSPNPLMDLTYQGVPLKNGIIVPGPQAGVPSDLELSIVTPTKAMFNYVNDFAILYARLQGGDLISSISASNRLAVQEAIVQSFTTPRTPRETSQIIRRIIGLHPRWAKAVERFYDKNLKLMLDNGFDESKALQQAHEATVRYRTKLIRRRAEMIARTEISQAQNLARQAAWEAAERIGLVAGETMKEWRTAPLGSRYGPPCDVCTMMRHQRVPWNGVFENGQSMPPAHPNCRCTAVLIPPSRGLQGLPSQSTKGWVDALDLLYEDLVDGEMLKHEGGGHDQKTHGRWATGSVWYAGNEVAPGLYEFHYGDMTFSRSPMYGLETIADEGMDTWGAWEGNYAMRSISAHMMGVERPPTAGGDLVDAEERRAYENGDSTGLYDGARQRVEDNIYQTYAVMDAVHRSEPTTLPLYRGMQVPANSSVLEMKPGDEFMVPLSAFSFDQDLAQAFSKPSSAPGAAWAPDYRGMILRLAPGAKGASTPLYHQIKISAVDDEWIAVPDEVVTQGTFRVTNVEQTGDTIFVDIEHVDYMNVGGGGFVSVG